MSYIEFSINGQNHKVDSNTPRYTVLREYIHYVAGLPGTKAMCLQGGCGACLVLVKALRLTTGRVETFTVNSCLVLVFQCHGWEITTVEGVGNRLEGYSDVQKRIAAMNGSQCGYCTPGWVMQLTSLKDKGLTMEELEKSFASNTCRCTGYRPLLDAIKSFANDYPKELPQEIKDIEDLNICARFKTKKHSESTCSSNSGEWCIVENLEKISQDKVIKLSFGKDKFYKVYDEEDIFDILDEHGEESSMMIDGNTGRGVFHYALASIVIDISDVKPLKMFNYDQNLVMGANISLEDCIHIFKEASESHAEFSYLAEMAKHLQKVAHIPIRKIGSLAGNLMLKHMYPTYQSDVYLLLDTVGAMVTIRSKQTKNTISMSDFLNANMRGKLMVNIELPPLNDSYIFRTEKIMPRHQNALAIVNAAFLIKLNIKQIVDEAHIGYGNISADFSRATLTEAYLKGKSLFMNETIQHALQILNTEIKPIDNPPEIPPEYRKKLALGIFYKFILSICPPTAIEPKYLSGSKHIQRPLSQGKQNFQIHPDLYPLNEPMPKLESVFQSSGEAQYANDNPPTVREVFGAFVLSTVHAGEVDYIDLTQPLEIKDILAVYTAEDIPGKNSFTVPGIEDETEFEEVLATSIKYYGQPVAIVVAENFELARSVAKKIKVFYKNVSSNDPVLTIEAAKKDSKRYTPSDEFSIKPKGRGNDVKNFVKGFYELHHQYHYYLEPISCVATPIENGLEIHDSSQWMNLTQSAVAKFLNISENKIIVSVRRIGGGFGGKISRHVQTSAACALVAKKLNVTCRFVLPLETNMIVPGKRLPCQMEYEVGVDSDGKIQYLNASIIEDFGCSHNENVLPYTMEGFKNCYDTKYFNVNFASVLTDLPSNTWTRAPGDLEGIACIEQIMEHIAFETNKDSDEVRMTNMRKEDNDLPILIETLKKNVDYSNRVEKIKSYNEKNRWMKKAIETSVMIFPVEFIGNFTVMISVYSGDGTVTITTGGVEMGQGINTKAAQVCAYKLGIPLHYITVLPNFSFIATNNIYSGGAVTTSSICFGVIKVCDMINHKIEPIKAQMKDPTWLEIVKKAAEQFIDLTAEYMMSPHDKGISSYNAYGVAILEVQLDVLLGTFEILRADILEDVGLSTNPTLDVGQLEGAYVQGLGYFTSEKLVFDNQTGRLLTNHFLDYHVPLALDIPADFRINLRYNSKNPKGVLGAKAVGEMGICLSHGITHALRKCVLESLSDSGYERKWIPMDMPCDIQSILKALNVKIKEFIIKPNKNSN